MTSSKPSLILQNAVSLSISHVALNPLITAPLLYLLTLGPPQLRNRLASHVAALRNPQHLPRILNALKALVVLGLLGTANQQLNKVALNAGRWRSEKKRWELSKEIAVVTGGCGGIGALVVKGLAKHGVKVAVLDVVQLPEELQGHENVHFFACDITDPTAIASTADRIRTNLGPPSVLVNNAGIAKSHTILDTSDDYLRKIFNVNLLSNFTLVKAFLPDMIVKNKGHIVTVASVASFIGVGGLVDYCSTKAGVLSFHEGLNQELRHHYKAPGVITTSIHPNWVNTPLVKSWEKELRVSNDPVIEPQVVADAILYHIVNATGGQEFLPRIVKNVSMLRGFPNWLQEYVRVAPSKIVLSSVGK